MRTGYDIREGSLMLAARQEPRFWVVLADGTLKQNLTAAEYDRLTEAGLTIDGGEQ